MKKQIVTRFALLIGIMAVQQNVFCQSKGIGIGIPSPDSSAMLQVVSASQGVLLPQFTSGTVANIQNPADGLLIYRTDENTHYQYSDSNDWQPVGNWLMNGTDIYNANSGNVGIGTNTPKSKLDVEGGISVGSTYAGTNAAPANGAIIEGNVGIGINVNGLSGTAINGSSPIRAKLHVGGLTDADNVMRIGDVNRSGGAGGSAGTVKTKSTLEFASYRNYWHPEKVGAKIQAVNVVDDGCADSRATHLLFFTDPGPSTCASDNPDQTVERMRISDVGNVGIGTVSPRGHFDVDGSGNIWLTDDGLNSGGQSLYLPGHIFIAPYNGSDNCYIQARRSDDSGYTKLILRTCDGSGGGGGIIDGLSIDGGNRRVTIGYDYANPYFLYVIGGMTATNYVLFENDLDVWFNLEIGGTLTKGSGAFKIDHPLDPANKYLYHSFVESPDMMNIYNGNIVTDASGVATVELPDYFEALNKDFRYQLTVIGAFAQAIIAQEIAGNKFVIKTDKPNVKVSWQVTGIRHDAYANKNRIPNSVDKAGDERGLYLHPDAFGLSEDYNLKKLQQKDAQPKVQ